jgi:hypothetical protein
LPGSPRRLPPFDFEALFRFVDSGGETWATDSHIMPIQSAIGVFFVVLALVFAVAAGKDYASAGRQWTPAGRTRRRVSVIFAGIGLGLIFWHYISRRTS